MRTQVVADVCHVMANAHRKGTLGKPHRLYATKLLHKLACILMITDQWLHFVQSRLQRAADYTHIHAPFRLGTRQ